MTKPWPLLSRVVFEKQLKKLGSGKRFKKPKIWEIYLSRYIELEETETLEVNKCNLTFLKYLLCASVQSALYTNSYDPMGLFYFISQVRNRSSQSVSDLPQITQVVDSQCKFMITIMFTDYPWNTWHISVKVEQATSSLWGKWPLFTFLLRWNNLSHWPHRCVKIPAW